MGKAARGGKNGGWGTPMEGRRGAKGEFYRQQTPIQTQHPQHSPISWQRSLGAAAIPWSSELGCGNTGNEHGGLTLRPATAHGSARPITPVSHIHGRQEGPRTQLCLLLWIDPLSHTGTPRETGQCIPAFHHILLKGCRQDGGRHQNALLPPRHTAK